MFELSVAGKYLTPKWRQLSVSIISLISILVIALVVWLIVVFFSVTNGLEKSWIQKLVALTAPARITPTEEYYNSFYYLSDSLSSSSDYTLKSIGEKNAAASADPYDPSVDEEIPHTWPKPDLNAHGELKDLVKLAFDAAYSLNAKITAKDFEMTGGHLHLRLVRSRPMNSLPPISQAAAYQTAALSQAAYLGSFDPENHWLTQAILPLTVHDAANLLTLLEVSNSGEADESESEPAKADMHDYLTAFFSHFEIHQLKTPSPTFTLPRRLLPNSGKFSAWGIYKNDKLLRIVLPQHAKDPLTSLQNANENGYKTLKMQLEMQAGDPYFSENDQTLQPVPRFIPIALAGDMPLSAKIDAASLSKARKPSDVLFDIQVNLQGITIEGKLPLKNLVIAQADTPAKNHSKTPLPALWVNTQPEMQAPSLALPSDSFFGDGILLPKSFRDVGVAVGDRGRLSYATPTTSSVQEQQIPVFVAGFYEPGVIPTGGKIILVNQEVTSLIRSSLSQEDSPLTNGINVRFDPLEQADEIKHHLQAALSDRGIEKYWKVETYRDYEFTKDLIKQLQSEKNLFTLLATLIILVACSNIVSMLIILVNDKKMEIGILRSMGASSLSIALIFGSCGIFMGVMGSLLGTLAAVLTLKNLPILVNLISRIQGHDMFNPIYFGENLPTDLSFEALAFVMAATTLISLIAGLVPAIKASLVRPSTILRSE